jgi:DNA-binding MarR family transcriptional regulator
MDPQSGADKIGTEFAGQLFFWLWRASHARTAVALETVGLTPPLFAVLNVIGAREGCIQGELAATLGIDPSTMVSLIDQLEGAGLAHRRPSPRDRRARELAISPPGRRRLDAARRLAAGVEDEVLAGLTAAERRRLLELLRRALASTPRQPPWTAADAG